MSKALNKARVKEFVRNFIRIEATCLYCDAPAESLVEEFGEAMPDDDYISVPTECPTCGNRWFNVYVLAGVQFLDEPDPDNFVIVGSPAGGR